MPATRRRRIVRRTAIVLTCAVVVLAVYVMSWAFLPRAARAGYIGWPTVLKLEATVFAPLTVCAGSDLPGAGLLHIAWNSVNEDTEDTLRLYLSENGMLQW
jgi:hypothetical protein